MAFSQADILTNWGGPSVFSYTPSAAKPTDYWWGQQQAAQAAPAPNEAMTNANTQMQDFLKSSAPQFQAAQYQGPGPNRFEAGLSSSERRMNALLDDPSSIQQTAAYKFRLGQGQEALQRQQAAKGMLGSGNRLMELTKYGQDMASQEYENQAQRLQSLLGTYSGAWNQAQGTNVQEALGRFGTEMQGALGSYNTAMQGHTARGNTLADLLKTAQAGSLAQQSMASSQTPTVQRAGFRTLSGGGTGTFI